MSDVVTGKAQRSGLITRGGSALLRLAWKLFMLPLSITGGILRLVTGSIRLFFWVAAGLLSYSLTMIGLARHQESPSSFPDTISVSAASEVIDSSSEIENLCNTESTTPCSTGSITESTMGSEAIDFLSEFEMEYGKMHVNFVSESFMDAVQRSRCEFKLLFVYLHAPDHPDTLSFCKETLCSETLSAFVNENFVAWGYSVAANGGLKMRKKLKKFTCRFPFCAVIMAPTAQSIFLIRQVSDSQLSTFRFNNNQNALLNDYAWCLIQFEGIVSPEEMLAELQTVVNESTATLVAARLDPDEQDAAYRSAPEADKAKEDQNQLEKEGESANWFEEKVLSIGPEPEKGPGVTQVLVRLPNGEREG